MTTTYDVAAFLPNGAQTLASPTNNGQLVTGTAKLVQRFACRLLMQLGSMPYLPLQGCNFINMLTFTGMNTEADVFTAFAGAMLNLRPQLQQEESSTDPADECFASATLNTVTITAEALYLDITVMSLAGGTVNMTLPLAFNLQ